MNAATSELTVAIDVSVVPAKPAGVGRYVVDLVEALRGRDDVALRLVARRDDTERWIRSGGNAPEILAVAPNSLAGRLAFGEWGVGRAASRSPRPGVLHGPHYTLPAHSSLPGVVTVHDLTMIEHPEWHERSKVAFFGRAIRLAARRAAVIVVPSAGVATAYRSRFGDRTEIAVVPHGLDHERFRTDEAELGSDAAALARLGVGARYVLHVGTIEPRKNLPGLLAAFDRLADDDANLTLVLAGGAGWGMEEFNAALGRTRAAERVLRLGYVDDDAVASLLRRAGAVAYPSFEEGFGLPVLEALACGAPLVTTADSVMSELAGDAALLVRHGDTEGLSAALGSILAGDPELATRREEGLSIARAHSWPASAAGHVEVYRRAILATK